MAPRSTGKVSIRLGQITVPAKTYVAVDDPPSIQFTTLHRACGSKLKQQMFCARDNTVVAKDDQAKGYEIGKDRYLMLEPGEFEALAPEPDPVIDVEHLVELVAIDPLHWNTPRYLGPDVAKGPVVDTEPARLYRWLVQVLGLSAKAAIGRYACRGRDALVAIRASGGRLVLQEVRRAGEVRDAREIAIPDAEVGDHEIDLGLSLVERLSIATFNAGAYPDRLYEATVAALQRKIDGEEVRTAPPACPVVSLGNALAAQLEELGPRKGPKRAPRAARARAAPAKAG
jgi:DNA end-binding protein Ku